MILLRRELGQVLRDRRRSLGRTLRDVSASAKVSLGYLSEVERGEKEASSELISSSCAALDVPLSVVLAAAERRARPVPRPVGAERVAPEREPATATARSAA